MMRLIPRLGFIQNKKHPVIVVLTITGCFFVTKYIIWRGGSVFKFA